MKDKGVDQALKKGVVRAIEGLGLPKPHSTDSCELCALKRTTGTCLAVLFNRNIV
jgi:hypothetical protein